MARPLVGTLSLDTTDPGSRRVAGAREDEAGGCGRKKWTLATVPCRETVAKCPVTPFWAQRVMVTRLPDPTRGAPYLPAEPWDHCPCPLVGQCSHVQGRHPACDSGQVTSSLSLGFLVLAPHFLSLVPGLPLLRSWLPSPSCVSLAPGHPLSGPDSSPGKWGLTEFLHRVVGSAQLSAWQGAGADQRWSASFPPRKSKVPPSCPSPSLFPEIGPQASRRGGFSVAYFRETAWVVMDTGALTGSFQNVTEHCPWEWGSAYLPRCLCPVLQP